VDYAWHIEFGGVQPALGRMLQLGRAPQANLPFDHLYTFTKHLHTFTKQGRWQLDGLTLAGFHYGT
jgi:hypothetical protein